MTAKELREWRLRHELTRDQLAALLSPSRKEQLSVRTVERWEQNRSAKIPVFLRLALNYLETVINFQHNENNG